MKTIKLFFEDKDGKRKDAGNATIHDGYILLVKLKDTSIYDTAFPKIATSVGNDIRNGLKEDPPILIFDEYVDISIIEVPKNE